MSLRVPIKLGDTTYLIHNVVASYIDKQHSTIKQLEEENRKLIDDFKDQHNHWTKIMNEKDEEIEQLEYAYNDLILSVKTKHENESRHATAKRYIIERERKNIIGSGKALQGEK